MTKWAIIKTQFEANHYWEGAMAEVSFLKNSHRHKFFVELWIEQEHNERDVEYITEKEKLDIFLTKFAKQVLPHSCETFAEMIKQDWERRRYPRRVKVGVWEDNENGAFLE